MASYYYLISSLPMLRADSAMPFSYDSFLGMCSASVPKDKFELLKNLTVASEKGPLVEEWAKFYGLLSKEMSYQRNTKLGRPAEAPTEHEEVITRTVQTALSSENPLVAEQMLLELEFKRLDELIGLHSFDDYMLFGYALKLKLLERLTAFDSARGRAEFQRLFDGIEAQIRNA